MNFLFQLPELEGGLSDKAKDAASMAFLVERLAGERRKRVAHRDGRPENVAEHSLMTAKVAVALAGKYCPNLAIGKVAQYAICHDDIEAYVGDTPSGEWANTDYDAKQALELKGREQLQKEFESSLPDYVQTVLAYEEQDKPEARFVRVVDKLCVQLMHLVDQGGEVNKHFTAQSYLSNERHRHSKMKDYDDWDELVDLMPEIADYIAKHLMKDDKP